MPEPQPLRDLAHEAFEERNWDVLEFHARQMRQQDPTDAIGRSYLGVAMLASGRVEQGLAEHVKAVQFGPNESVTWHNYANALLIHGDHSEALVAIQKAIALDQTNYLSWRILLSTHANLLQITAASQVVDKVHAMFGEEELKKDPLLFRASRLRSPVGVHEFAPNLFIIQVTRESPSEVVCEDTDLGVYGVGASFAEAYDSYTEMFYAVFADMPEALCNPLSDEAQGHASQRIAEMAEACDEVENDPELMESLERGLADIQAGRTTVWA